MKKLSCLVGVLIYLFGALAWAADGDPVIEGRTAQSIQTYRMWFPATSAPLVPSAGMLYSDGSGIYFYDGSGWLDLTTGLASDAQYLVLAPHAGLSQERVFTPQSPLQYSDGGAGNPWTLGLATAGIKATHIDWGTGAGQISADSIPDGSTKVIITSTQASEFGSAYAHIGDTSVHVPDQTTHAGKFLSTDGTATSWQSVVMSETDPVFSAWDKSTGISITESQISDLKTYAEVGSSLTGFSALSWQVFYSDGSGDIKELGFGTSGQFLKSTGAASAPQWDSIPGGGDMLASTYDPGGIGQNVYNVDYHIDGTTNKVFTATNQTTLGTALQPGDSITDLDATSWRVFYSDGSGNVNELGLGTSGQFLRSTGATSAPTWDAISGGGDMLASVYDPTSIAGSVYDMNLHYWRDFITTEDGKVVQAEDSPWVLADKGLISGMETDPVFVAWDRSTGISITESQISDLQSYVVTETDPVWTSVVGNYYTISNLQSSGHSSVHFNNLTNKPTTLGGYGITNAMSTAHAANVITSTNITNWNTAYGVRVASWAAPLVFSANQAGLSFNSTNLQLTGSALNTVQDISTSSTPQFAGLKIGSLSGVLRATSGTVSGSSTTDHLPEGASNKYFTVAAARGVFSTTATGLSYDSSSGVLSLTAGYVVPTSTKTTEWDTAYSERRQWDGGSTNLNATTARSNLNVPTRTGGDASGSWNITAALATNKTGGAANQILYQTGENQTGFITPSGSNTYLKWTGSGFAWDGGGGGGSSVMCTVSPAPGSSGSPTDITTVISSTSSGTICLAEGYYSITSNAVLPATANIRFARGAVINVGAHTLTLLGGIEAGPWQIFSWTSGRVTPGTGRYQVPKVYAEWWGAIADDTNDDFAALQAAIRFIVEHGNASAKLQLLPGVYRISSTLMIPRGCVIEGAGAGRSQGGGHFGTGTRLRVTTSNTTAIRALATALGFGALTADENQYIHLSKLRVDNGGLSSTNAYGFHGSEKNDLMAVIEDAWFIGMHHGIYTLARVWGTRVWVTNTASHGIVYLNGGDQVLFRDTIVVNANGNGFDLNGLYARLLDCETYGCLGWGVKAFDVEIVGGYYNNDYEGEVYIYQGIEYGRGGSITGAVIEWAGDTSAPRGYKNSTGIGIKYEVVVPVGQSPLVSELSISGCYIHGSQGYGIVQIAGRLMISDTYIGYSGEGGTQFYDLHQTDGWTTVQGCTMGPGGHGAYATNSTITLTNNHIQSHGATVVSINGTSIATIANNFIYTHNPTSPVGISIASAAAGTTHYVGNQFGGYLAWSGTKVSVAGASVAVNKILGDLHVAGNITADGSCCGGGGGASTTTKYANAADYPGTDTAKIQAAINNAENKPVFIPAGTWTITEPLNLTRARQIITGAGAGRTILVPATIGMTFSGTPTTGVFNITSGEPGPVIRDLEIRFTQANTSNRSLITRYIPGVYVTNNSNRFKLQNVTITNAWDAVYCASNEGGSFFSDMDISAYRYGFHFNNVLDNLRFRNIHVGTFNMTSSQIAAMRGSGTTDTSTAFYIIRCDGVQISNSKIEKVGIGIRAAGDSTPSAVQYILSGTSFLNVAYNAVQHACDTVREPTCVSQGQNTTHMSGCYVYADSSDSSTENLFNIAAGVLGMSTSVIENGNASVVGRGSRIVSFNGDALTVSGNKFYSRTTGSNPFILINTNKRSASISDNVVEFHSTTTNQNFLQGLSGAGVSFMGNRFTPASGGNAYNIHNTNTHIMVGNDYNGWTGTGTPNKVGLNVPS